MENKRKNFGCLIVPFIFLFIVSYNMVGGSSNTKRVDNRDKELKKLDAIIESGNNAPERDALETDLWNILSEYTVSYIDMLTLTEGGYSTMIGIETNIEDSLGQDLYNEVESKVKTVIDDYSISIIKNDKIIAN